MANISLPSVSDVEGFIKDPAPSWRFVVQMPDLLDPSTVKGITLNDPGFPALYDGLLATKTVPFGFVEAIQFGTRRIDADHRFAAGSTDKFPRFIDVPTITILLYENDKYDSFRFIRSWMNQIVDEDHNYGIPALYKRDINLYAFDVVSNSIARMIGKLNNCWPTAVQVLTYEYGKSDRIVLPVEFSVDEDYVSFE